jgi:hypothetical protein
MSSVLFYSCLQLHRTKFYTLLGLVLQFFDFVIMFCHVHSGPSDVCKKSLNFLYPIIMWDIYYTNSLCITWLVYHFIVCTICTLYDHTCMLFPETILVIIHSLFTIADHLLHNNCNFCTIFQSTHKKQYNFIFDLKFKWYILFEQFFEYPYKNR